MKLVGPHTDWESCKLCYTPTFQIFSRWQPTVHPDPGNSSEDDDDVNAWITLGFALGNMLFDVICLLNFFKSHKQTGRDSMLQ